MTMDNSIFKDVFETDPLGRQALFQSHIPRGFDLTDFQQQAFGRMYESFFNKYLGQLGQQVKTGQSPSLGYADFLEQQDFGRQLRRAPTDQTGRGTSPLLSAARFLFNR